MIYNHPVEWQWRATKDNTGCSADKGKFVKMEDSNDTATASYTKSDETAAAEKLLRDIAPFLEDNANGKVAAATQLELNYENALRIFSQLEEAWWKYTDTNPAQYARGIPVILRFELFAWKIVQLHPLWRSNTLTASQFDVLYKGFLSAKAKLDVCRVFLFNRDASKVLLVESWNNRNYWTLPGGKRNPWESKFEAAMREVREETGFDALRHCQEPDFFVDDQVTFFIGRNVPEDVVFLPQTRKEVRLVQFHRLRELSPKSLSIKHSILQQLCRFMNARGWENNFFNMDSKFPKHVVNDSKYKCQICRKGFQTDAARAQHYDAAHGDHSLNSTKCAEVVCESGSDKSICMFTCELCGDVFNAKGAYAQHYNDSHGIEEKRLRELPVAPYSCQVLTLYRCGRCKMDFSTPSAAVQHAASSHNKPIDFTLLPSFSNIKAANEVTKVPSGALLCGLCGRMFCSVTEVGYHSYGCWKTMGHKYPESEADVLRTADVVIRTKPGLVCSQCTFTCNNEAAMGRHIKDKHTIVKQQMACKCALCGAAFRSAAALSQHSLMSHPTEAAAMRSFQCDNCWKEFRSEASLHQHKLSPCDIRCNTCRKKFKDLNSLEVHIERVHHQSAPETPLHSLSGDKKINHETNG